MLREVLTPHELDELGLDGANEEPPPQPDVLKFRKLFYVRNFATTHFLGFWMIVTWIGFKEYRSSDFNPSMQHHFVFGSFLLTFVAIEAFLSVWLNEATFSSWDAFGLFVGVLARSSIYGDFLFVMVTSKVHLVLFRLSTFLFAFEGIFLFTTQLRGVLALYSLDDHFSFERPQLCCPIPALTRIADSISRSLRSWSILPDCCQMIGRRHPVAHGAFVESEMVLSSITSSNCTPSHAAAAIDTNPHGFSSTTTSDPRDVLLPNNNSCNSSLPVVDSSPVIAPTPLSAATLFADSSCFRWQNSRTPGSAGPTNRDSIPSCYSVSYCIRLMAAQSTILLSRVSSFLSRAMLSGIRRITLGRRNNNLHFQRSPLTSDQSILFPSTALLRSHIERQVPNPDAKSITTEPNENKTDLCRVADPEMRSTGVEDTACSSVLCASLLKKSEPASLESDCQLNIPRYEDRSDDSCVHRSPNLGQEGANLGQGENVVHRTNTISSSALNDAVATVDLHRGNCERTVSPMKVLQLANSTHQLDLLCLESVLVRNNVHADLVEAHEFSAALVSVGRCFLEDILQLVLKLYVLIAIGINRFVLASAILSCLQSVLLCLFNTADMAVWEDLTALD